MEEIAGSVSFLAILGFVAFLIWNREQSNQARRRQRQSERERLFEQIGTGENLTSFLQSDEGKRLLEEIHEPVNRKGMVGGMKSGVVILTTTGVISLSLAAGFFFLANRLEPDLIFPGAIVGSVGLGCIAAALIHYLLGKAWGLIRNDWENGSSQRRIG